MNGRQLVQRGDVLEYAGHRWRITAFVGPDVHLQRADQVVAVIAWDALTNSKGFRQRGAPEPDEFPEGEVPLAARPDWDAVLTGLPPEKREQVRRRVKHLFEAATGFPSGNACVAASDEPRAAYDPSLVPALGDRFRAKADELAGTDDAVSAATLRRWWDRYASQGPLAVADQRWLRAGEHRQDPRYFVELKALVAERELRSTVDRKVIRIELLRRLRDQYGLDADGQQVVSVPSYAQFCRHLRQLFGVRKTAKRRQTDANRPDGPRRDADWQDVLPTRPGQFVVFDASPFEVLCLSNLDGGKPVRLHLVVAMDLATGVVCDLRLCDVAKGVDAAAMLANVISPLPMAPWWPEACRWRYLGVPDQIFVPAVQAPLNGLKPACKPPIHPECVVIDNGLEFDNAAFLSGCLRLNIDLQRTRPRTPTDKPSIERFFLTVRAFMQHMPGHVGASVVERGADPEGEVRLTWWQLEEALWQWVCGVYHATPQRGNIFPEFPRDLQSPNEMYDEAISRAGMLWVPRDPDLRFELLETHWRVVNSDGVYVDGLVYDADWLRRFRKPRRPRQPRREKTKYSEYEWAFRRDPRDATRLWFKDEDTGEWLELPWRGRKRNVQPFADVMARHARRRLGPEKVSTRERRAELEDALVAILDGLDDPSTMDARTRRVVDRSLNQTARAYLDSLPTQTPDEPDLPEPEIEVFDGDIDEELPLLDWDAA